MNKLVLIVLGWLPVAVIAGCADTPRAVDWPEARKFGEGLPSFRAPDQPDQIDEGAHTFTEPAGTLTLREAFAAALLNNPDLATVAWEIRVREARALQSSLLPNPEVEIEVEDFGGSGNAAAFDAAETTVLFSQLIELGNKRRKRTRLAELNQDLAAWDYETARVAVLTSVARAFIATLVHQELIELADQNLSLAREAYRAIDKRVKAGADSPLDRTRASVVVARAKITLQQRRRGLESARLELASAWGSRQPQFEEVTGNLSQLNQLPAMDALSSVVNQNPRVARWAVEITQRQAQIELERSKATPDVTVGVGGKYLGESDDAAAAIQVSVPLPIFDRNQGGVLESRYELAKARQSQRAAELRVGTALGRAYQRLAAAHEEVAALETEVLPAAKRAYEDTNTAYQQGKVGYLSVLDAQRTFFEARGQVVGALGAYHQAVVDVEGLIGQRLSTLETENQSNPNPDVKHTQPTGAQP